LRRVSKRFRTVAALESIDLEVGPGEIVALVGPNGAGKSTLLRILATAILPDSGEVVVAGHDVTRDPVMVRRSIGFLLPDERSWYWRLTGRHNLEFFAALYGFGREAATRRADELLGEFGLRDAADRSFGGYSSGMRLRLSLARALLANPPVLLLDEPTRSIDPIGAEQFRELFRDAAGRRNVAVLFASHDLHEAAEIATRTAILVEGRLSGVVEQGTDAAGLELRLRKAVHA
jgi:ABC-2 type transport system ATP-binding protein